MRPSRQARRRAAAAALLLTIAGCGREGARPVLTSLPVRPASAPAVSDEPGATEPAGNEIDESPIPSAEVAAFTAGDDVQLYGHTFRPGRKAGVILLHASNADERSWFAFAQRLVAAGYTALTFDFRGYRASEGAKDPSKAPSDVEGAIDFIRLQGAERIALVGAELGGTAAVTSANMPSVRAIAAVDAGPSSGSLDASSAAARVKVDALVVSTGSPDAERLAGMMKGSTLEKVGPSDQAGIEQTLLRFIRRAMPV